MKRFLCVLALAVMPTLVFWSFGSLPVLAVEEHHQQPQKMEGPDTQQASGPQRSPAMMGKTGAGMGMMGKDAGGGMMGMMGMGQGSGGGMMGMMHMMMSHMMGGPGGMGSILGLPGGMGSGGGKGMGSGMMEAMSNRLAQLDLSPQQWEKIRNLARQRLLKIIDLQAQRAKLRVELAGLRWDQKPDTKRIKELFVKQAETKAEMFIAGIGYLNAIKDVLTPEQVKRLDIVNR